ncbi:MAG: DUF748 domain-containing protein [Telmatospirillum sp.]|nr:DUF748 domain-containing protein [Telmatospirillum sp.]
MARLDKHSLRSVLGRIGARGRSKRIRRIGLGLLIVILLFGLAGFLGAPPLIRNAAERQLAEQLGRPVSIQRVAVNPYTLRLEADGIQIGERGSGGAFIEAEKLIVRASWTSLPRLAPIIDQVKLVRPSLHLVRFDAEHFNFSDLLAPGDSAGASKDTGAPAGPPRLAISNIQVEDGRIDFDDRLLSTHHVLDQWFLDIPFIATLPSKADIFVEPRLHARIDGNLVAVEAKTKPFRPDRPSTVSLKADHLDVPDLLSYVPAGLPVTVVAGRLSSDLALTFSREGDQPALSLTGGVEVEGADIRDKAGQPLFAAEGLHVEAAGLDPLREILHFGDIRVDRPTLHLVRGADGLLNIDRLSMGDAPPAPAATKDAPRNKSPDPPLDLAVRHVAIEGGVVTLKDDATRIPADLSLTGLTVGLSDLSLTADSPAPFQVAFDVAKGGTLKAEGTVTPATGRAETRLSIESLPLPLLQPYLADVTTGRVTDGTIGLSATVSADWSKAPVSALVSDGRISLKSLKVLLPDARTPAISLSEGRITLSRADAAARTVDVEGIDVTGLSVAATRLPGGDIDLAALADGGSGASPPLPSSRRTGQTGGRTKPAEPPADPGWHYRIGEVTLKDARVTVTDRTTPKPVTLDLSPLQITARQIGDDGSKPIPIKVATTLNHQGSLDLEGDIAPSPLKAGLKVSGKHVDLSAFAPYLQTALNATIASAFLETKGDLSLDGTAGTVRAGWKGDVALMEVKVQNRVTGDPFGGWRTFAVTDLIAGYDEARGITLDAGRVAIANFFGNVLLDAQGRLSLQDVIVQDGGGPSQAAGGAAKSGRAAPVRMDAPQAALRLRLGQLLLQNGRVTYTDNFIRPNYTAHLVAISGTIGAFGTQSGTPAPVDVTAQLSGNGPITIKGTVNPLVDLPSLDLTAVAQDVELTHLTPYSTKYAGYPITRGKLNVDLHYQLADNDLTANNHIFIDQLTFGDHVDNDTATSLPVRLAIDLMKNSRGQIDVNIPVSGSLSNPEFSLGDIIGQAFLHLLEKAVTSPFTLLASAFGGEDGPGGDDLGYLEFSPGSDDLTEASRKKLDAIAAMLADRPAITLSLAGRADPDPDLPGLRDVYVDRLVRQRKVRDQGGDPRATDLSTVAVGADEYSDYLTEAYGDADFERPRTMIGLLKTLPDAEMKKALADHAPVTDQSLDGLARRRADAARRYLDGRIDPGRILMAPPVLSADGIADKGATTRVDMTLK